MQKRRNRKNENNIPKIVKTIPLSLAVAAFATGTAFADTDFLHVQDHLGRIVEVDMATYNADSGLPGGYKDIVKTMLKNAFVESRQIMVHDSETDNWVEFGQNTKEGLSLDQILADQVQYEAVNPGDTLIDPGDTIRPY
ncbi:MAG: hypothetical protein LBU58_01665 [Clostridiales bacterium]|jgi:hypothetical protein|nr:hypothetical protein [Clostridiales bacterium]